MARSSALIWSEMIICSTTWWAIPGKVFWSRSNRTAPVDVGGPQRSGSHPNFRSPQQERACVTVRDGLPELQQTAEGQRSHVRFPPSVCFLLHVFLKLDPSGSLLPLQLLVLVHSQLVQLHKDLETTGGDNHTLHTGRISKINANRTLEHSTCLPKNFIHDKSFPGYCPKFEFSVF